MKHETLILLKSGRFVKVVANENASISSAASAIEWDILIKDPKETDFHPLIGNSHPIYWKLRRLSPLQRKQMQLQYSGINKTEIKTIVAKLENSITDQVNV